MSFDTSINLGTMLHLGISLLTALTTVACIYGAVKTQIASIHSELKEIKDSLGCTDADVAKLGDKSTTVNERIASLERDMDWLKQGKK